MTEKTLNEIKCLEEENAESLKLITKLVSGNVFGNDGYVVGIQNQLSQAIKDRMALRKEIKLLQTENEKLKINAAKYEILLREAGKAGLNEEDLLELVKSRD